MVACIWGVHIKSVSNLMHSHHGIDEVSDICGVVAMCEDTGSVSQRLCVHNSAECSSITDLDSKHFCIASESREDYKIAILDCRLTTQLAH